MESKKRSTSSDSGSYEYTEKKRKSSVERSNSNDKRWSSSVEKKNRDYDLKRDHRRDERDRDHRRDDQGRDYRRDDRDRDYRRDDRDRDYRRDDRDRDYRRDDRDDRDRDYRRDERDRDYRRDERNRDYRRDDRNYRDDRDYRRDRKKTSSNSESYDDYDELNQKNARTKINDKKSKIDDLLRKSKEDELEQEKLKKRQYEEIEKELNPLLVIEQCLCKKVDGSQIKINVIRDDNLIGGTKQRGIYKYIEKYSDINEFVFAGSCSSFVQLGLANSCARLKKRATLFIQNPTPGKIPVITNLAKKLGASAQVFYDQVSDVQLRANEYVETKNKEKNEVMLMPFSLGTGSLLKVIGSIWEDVEIMPVSVSKKLGEENFGIDLWNRMGGLDRVTLLTSPQKFFQPVQTNLVPPYNSLLNFDAKVWQFIVKYGDEGDYVWNCAGEPK